MIEVYKYTGDPDNLELVFRVNDDATVDGSNRFADRTRNVLENFSEPAEDYIEAIEVIIEYRYNNASYVTNRG
jgi:hypothetical protein